jgi:hypothetical protein
MLRSSIYGITALILAASPIFGQPLAQFEPPKWAGRVEVKVHVDRAEEAEREGLKSTVESYLKRELRSLGDVTVVTEAKEDLDWVIWINVAPVRLTNDAPVGYAISMSVLRRPLSGKFVKAWLEPEHVSVKSIETISEALGQVQDFRGSQIYLSAKGDLQETCKRIVDTIDISFFEPGRKSIEDFREELRRGKQ